MPGWSFADVLPAFVDLESDLDFGDAAHHGADGPIPIRRYLNDEQSSVAAAATESLVAAGIAPIADHNAPWAVGVSPLPVNAVNGMRMSTAMTYLNPLRHRLAENLKGTISQRLLPKAQGKGRVVAAEIMVSTEAIKEYITDPKKKVPGNKMLFPGVKDELERDDLFAYLASFNADGSPKK